MKRRVSLLALLVALLAVGAAVAIAFVVGRDGGESVDEAALASAGRGFLSEPASEPGEPREPGESVEEEREDLSGLLLAAYRQRSYPQNGVAYAQTVAARSSFAALPFRVPPAQGRAASSPLALAATWRSLGPTVATALAEGWGNYRVRPANVSGRVTTLLVAPRCVPGDCRLWVGAAGGGVFRTNDALAPQPVWESTSSGLESSAIGYLAADPSDAGGQTIYAGTGEGNSSVDSEAGVGVYRSTNGGDSWSILAGSEAVAAGTAVTGIVVDPRRPQTVYISTASALHGTSSVVGGHADPAGAPTHGVYVSTDGGASFELIYPDVGGAQRNVRGIALDPNDLDTIYASVIGEGLLRRSQRLDGDTSFHRVFEFQGNEAGGSSRVEFALADLGSRTRIYVGSSNPFVTGGVANLYRADDAGLPAAEVRAGWRLLSSTDPASTGYGSYRYCGDQCWYGNVVASPPGQPDVVWLGGNFMYDEASRGQTAGRAWLRSTDAGVSFNDVTSDVREPRFEMHPDQHAIAFSPNDPDVAFLGSDGGVVRLSGEYANVAADRCAAATLGPLLANCRRLLSGVPTRIDDLNAGLDTLQLQSVSLSSNPQARDLLTGTQDNGTWSYSPERGWTNVAGGDGGQSGIDAVDPRIRFHSWFSAAVRINHSSGDPAAWRVIYAPLYDDRGDPVENVSFYAPIIADPRVGGTMFIGMQHVWRTQASGGQRAQIVASCDYSARIPEFCGDWVPLGGDLTGGSYGTDRFGEYVAAVERAPSDAGTLWAATLPGRVFVSKNADGAAASVTFARIDVPVGTPGQLPTPGRFVSSITVDPQNPNHAWISYSGYEAYTPQERGHVFEVVFDPGTGTATWTNRSYDLQDLPITDLVRDPSSGDLYAATDFGVLRLAAGATAWTEAARGLPFVAVYGLTITPDGRTLYAATHGRGLWAIDLS